MGSRRRLYPEPYYRRFPLPDYDDATRIWHFHVMCRTCVPKGTETETTRPLALFGEALALKRSFNESIARLGTAHRYVVEGCADETCYARPRPPTHIP